MVTYLLNMPQGQQLNLEKDEVELVLRVTYPVTIGRPSYTHYTLVDDQSNGDFSVNMNRRHVRIVGETRGDFEALRKALSIPSIIDGDAHALTQYSVSCFISTIGRIEKYGKMFDFVWNLAKIG